MFSRSVSVNAKPMRFCSLPPNVSRVDAGVADQLFGDAVLARVGELEGGRRKAVELDAPVAVGRAQLGRDCFVDTPQPAHVGAGVAIAVLLAAAAIVVERGDAIGRQVLARDAPREALTAGFGACLHRRRAALAAFGGIGRQQRSFGNRRDDVDDAADRLAAPQRRLRSAQHFDAHVIARQQVGEVEAAAGRGRIVELDAVDQHDCLVVLRAANAQLRGAAETSVARHGDARRSCEQIGDRQLLTGADLLGVDQRDRVADAGERLLDAIGADDDALELFGAGCIGTECARGREQAGQDDGKR